MTSIKLDDASRLAALERLHVLDTPPEDRFDRIVRLAAWVADAPIALLSLVDERRQWFKARVGLDASETPREHAFCAHVVSGGATMWVSDAMSDPRFRNNPFVTGDPHVRFYLGAPVRVSDGEIVGTVCVIDRIARLQDQALITRLEDLAAAAAAELERRAGEAPGPVHGLTVASDHCAAVCVPATAVSPHPAPSITARPSDPAERIREAEAEAETAETETERRLLHAIADLWRGLDQEQKLRRAVSAAA